MEVKREDLEELLHELNIHHGLLATDNPRIYEQAIKDGSDAVAAWDLFCENLIRIDLTKCISMIDKYLEES